jgi:hypothetical protein
MEECWSIIFEETSPLSRLISNGTRTQILKLIKHMGKAYVLVGLGVKSFA